MKTEFLIIIVIIAIVASSAITYSVIPEKNYISVYSPWLQDNLDASKKIRDSSIPIIGVDVDEKIGALTIYMTEENSERYIQEIDDLLDVPFDILTDTFSRELECLKTYRDIRETSRTHGASTSEGHIIKHQKHSLNDYVEMKCPDFSDLNDMKKNVDKFSIVVINQGASIEGRKTLIPQEITVVIGVNNTVLWINQDDVAHGIVGDDSENKWGIPRVLLPQESHQLRFTNPGIFPYHGAPHPWMTGTVIVLEDKSEQEAGVTFDYVIESDDGTYGSQYKIAGGIVDEITFDKDANSLKISLSESEKGYIQIVIQTGLIHTIDQLPFNYFVLLDGEEIDFEQLSPILLEIQFEKETKLIEIIGTFEI